MSPFILSPLSSLMLSFHSQLGQDCQLSIGSWNARDAWCTNQPLTTVQVSIDTESNVSLYIVYFVSLNVVPFFLNWVKTAGFPLVSGMPEMPGVPINLWQLYQSPLTQDSNVSLYTVYCVSRNGVPSVFLGAKTIPLVPRTPGMQGVPWLPIGPWQLLVFSVMLSSLSLSESLFMESNELCSQKHSFVEQIMHTGHISLNLSIVRETARKEEYK